MVNQLVSFGNFMIGKIYAEWLDHPAAIKDFGEYMRNREVTISDLEKWSNDNPDLYVKDKPAEDAKA